MRPFPNFLTVFACRRIRRIGGRGSRRRRDWLAFRNNRHLIDDHRRSGLILGIAIDQRNAFHHEHGVRITLSEDRIFAVECRVGSLCNKKLASICARAGVRHRQSSRDIEPQGGRDFVWHVEAGIAFTGSQAVAPLNHETGNHAVERGAIVKRLTLNLLGRDRIGPWFRAGCKADKIRGGQRCFLIKQLARQPSHRGVEEDGWAGRNGGRKLVRNGRGRVGQIGGRWRARWRSRGRRRRRLGCFWWGRLCDGDCGAREECNC
jgi:hypothetical protein